MAPEIQTVVRTTQAWLQASHHVQVPYAWLEACVNWLQEEAGGAGRLTQQQMNQQALDQWLMTDLRDLDHPVLPQGLAEAQKTQLRGNFCVQVDSLQDISQPAYTQLQKLKGTDCANDEVSAVTQTTQRPWEARPTRMLLLQVTDGVQSLEAMEYQPIPALSTALRPGAKLQLQGQMVCRLGMLLLGPSNLRVLGGEVEDLVDRNCQGRLLCRTLGLPEEQQQQRQQPEEAHLATQQAGDEMEDLDDAELLASLEEVQRSEVGSDSGYGTHSQISTQISRSSSVRSFASAVSSRSEASARSNRSSLTPSSRGGSLPGQQPERDDSYFGLSDNGIQPEVRARGIMEDSFPDADFDDLPLDELDSEIFQDPTPVAHSTTAPHNNGRAGDPHSEQNRTTEPLNRTSRFGSNNEPEEDDFMDEDMDCFLGEIETAELPEQHEPSGSERQSAPKDPQRDNTAPPLTLTSAPFTYLCLLDDPKSAPRSNTTEIQVKAFIVTLLGKLSSSSGRWSICATISDGTGYLDVELSDAVLTGLLGFSVADKASLKREPARRGELDAGMKRCQEELVDMCCVMSIALKPEGGRALVTEAEPVSERMLKELEQRKFTQGK